MLGLCRPLTVLTIKVYHLDSVYQNPLLSFWLWLMLCSCSPCWSLSFWPSFIFQLPVSFPENCHTLGHSRGSKRNYRMDLIKDMVQEEDTFSEFPLSSVTLSAPWPFSYSYRLSLYVQWPVNLTNLPDTFFSSLHFLLPCFINDLGSWKPGGMVAQKVFLLRRTSQANIQWRARPLLRTHIHAVCHSHHENKQ